MSHQDWTPVIIGKKRNNQKELTNSETVILKTSQSNKQNKTTTNISKIEDKMNNDTFELPKVTQGLKQQIQQARQEKNLTQKQLAQKCNLTESVIKNYESGNIVPSQGDIDKMSKALGIRLKNK